MRRHQQQYKPLGQTAVDDLADFVSEDVDGSYFTEDALPPAAAPAAAPGAAPTAPAAPTQPAAQAKPNVNVTNEFAIADKAATLIKQKITAIVQAKGMTPDMRQKLQTFSAYLAQAAKTP